MADELDTTPIHSLYAERFAADLETNRKEQEDLSSRITELDARLKQLKADEDWLCGVQGAVPPAGVLVGGSPGALAPAPLPATEEAPSPSSRAVPKPRQAKKASGTAPRARKAAPTRKSPGGATATKTRTATATRTKAAPATTAKAAPVEAAPAKATADAAAASTKTTAAKAATEAAAPAAPAKAAPVKAVKAVKAVKTTSAKAEEATPVKAEKSTPAARKAPSATPGKVAEPPLRELVLALLAGAAEPRMVSEVSTELTAAHPSRSTSTQVVRNTLEGLAKKGLIEKDNKQGSVMYTAPRPAVDGPAPVAPAEAKPAAATAATTVASEA
ncbi:hypothetical protein ACWGHI_23815 [Streptomyces sp. NPDC054912]